VADSGFDIGDQRAERPDPKALHHAFTHRIIDLVPLTHTTSSKQQRANDRTGHGIFVCGNIAANSKSSGLLCTIKGTASQARLVVLAIGNSSRSIDIPSIGYGRLFEHACTKYGARIHSRSFSSVLNVGVVQLVHDEAAEMIDGCANWNDRRDMLILVAAGNLLEAGHRGLFWCLSCLERSHRTVALQ
jgi:hypothetical protein